MKTTVLCRMWSMFHCKWTGQYFGYLFHYKFKCDAKRDSHTYRQQTIEPIEAIHWTFKQFMHYNSLTNIWYMNKYSVFTYTYIIILGLLCYMHKPKISDVRKNESERNGLWYTERMGMHCTAETNTLKYDLWIICVDLVFGTVKHTKKKPLNCQI